MADGKTPVERLLSGLDQLNARLDGFSARMDGIEKRTTKAKAKAVVDDDDADLNEPAPAKPGEAAAAPPADDDDDVPLDEQGNPAPLAADADLNRVRKALALTRHAHDAADPAALRQVKLANVQRRFDDLANQHGQRHFAPLTGETVRGYRIRSLNEHKWHSPAFRLADLSQLKGLALDVAEREIAHDSAQAAANPVVPKGYLHERTIRRGSHDHTEFHGSPSTWMGRYHRGRRFVTTINVTKPGNHGRPESWH
jgi:hypothetical protein